MTLVQVSLFDKKIRNFCYFVVHTSATFLEERGFLIDIFIMHTMYRVSMEVGIVIVILVKRQLANKPLLANKIIELNRHNIVHLYT